MHCGACGGSLDRVRPPPFAQAVAKAISGARYVELRTGHYMAVQTPDLISDCIGEFLKEPKLLIVTKAAVRSRVHRRVQLDYVGVKRFDPDGTLVGESVLCDLSDPA